MRTISSEIFAKINGLPTINYCVVSGVYLAKSGQDIMNDTLEHACKQCREAFQVYDQLFWRPEGLSLHYLPKEKLNWQSKLIKLGFAYLISRLWFWTLKPLYFPSQGIGIYCCLSPLVLCLWSKRRTRKVGSLYYAELAMQYWFRDVCFAQRSQVFCSLLMTHKGCS